MNSLKINIEKSLVVLLAVILATVFLLQLVLAPFVLAEPFAPSAEGVLSFPIPPDISKEEILHPEEPLKAWLHSLVTESLVLQNRLSQETGDLIEGKEDLVVVFIDHAGRPILQDMDAAKSRRSDAGSISAPAATVTNELTFTFNSPTYPWSAEELTTLSTALNDFYPTTKTIYGNPAFNITVNIRKDPTISFSGLYYVSLNEIVLRDASSMDVLCHEMIHAFRDDNIISLNSYEEGMTRAAEVEVFNRLANYTHWDENHSYEYDVYYEGLNRQVIGSQYGSFFNANRPTHSLTRYQLAGYAWAKALLENSNFLVDFNRELYNRTLSDPPTPSTESKLLAIATAIQSTVEGKPFQTWYAQQGVLNTNPPEGYFLYQRINQFTVDYFYRDPSGSETMQPDATIQWAVYDNQDMLLDSGSAVTSSYGSISFYPTLPAGYTGRIKVVATTSIPDGSISDISLRYAGSETGVFGIVPESNSGTITIMPLDEPTPPVILNVVNGAFSAPSLAAVKGRFLTDFTDTNGQSFSKQFTKDASNYFLIMAKVTTPGGIKPVHNINKGTNYTTIQAAIDDASPGDEVYVDSGTYYENVNVNKTLTLRGIRMPVVEAGWGESAIVLAADGIRLEGFAATYGEIGISVISNNNTLISNDVSNNANYGISLMSSSNNTLSGNSASGNWNGGISLESSSNNTLISNYANSNFGDPVNFHEGDGITLFSSSNNKLIGNNASDNDEGISVSSSQNNTLIGNNADSNNYGISLSFSTNNTLIGNNASYNKDGISLSSSSNNTLKNNMMKGNKYNFGLVGSSYSDFYNQIETTNLVDGKSVYYIKSARNMVYDSDTNAGTFYCINCVNITLKNLDLKSNSKGIFLWNTSYSRIQTVNASNNSYGISVYNSSNNILIWNNANSNYDNDEGYFEGYSEGYGIYMSSSSNNMLIDNHANSNYGYGHGFGYDNGDSYGYGYGYGIYLSSSNNNTLLNNIANSNSGNGEGNSYGYEICSCSGNGYGYGYGIYLSLSSNNTLSNNTANSNSGNGESNGEGYGEGYGSGYGIYLSSSSNNTLSNNTANSNSGSGSSPIGSEGYGISLSFSGNNKIYHNNLRNNTDQAYDDSTTNLWDNGYPSGGNYWSDYTGIDIKRGSGQDIPGSDSIGDTPYIIGEGAGAQDRYPLMDIIPLLGITITSPDGGENWTRDTTQTISWNYTGSPGSQVKIDLLKGEVFNATINASVSIGSGGSGSYNWLINSIQAPGNDYKIKLTSTTNSAYTDTSDNNFNISAQTGDNLIKNPGFENGTANWTFYTNGTGNFTIVSPGYEGAKAAKLNLISNGTNIQLYQKNVTLEPKGIYLLSFAAYSMTGHDLLIKAFQHLFPFTDYGLEETFDLGTNWETFTTEFTAANLTTTVNDGRLMFYLVPFVEAGDIYYIDDVRLEKIGVDNTPPAVIGNTPTGTNVLVTTPITVTFSEKMDQLATQEAFSISPASKGSFSWNGTNMTYIPDSNLAYNTSYTVTIGTGARDSAGNNLPSAYSWQFGTILPKPIIDCTTISSPGVYALNVDIMNHPGTCINITSSNVIFDGTGHKIDGTGVAGASGVNVHNTSAIITNITVTNLAVTDWDNGIYFTNAMGGSISKIIENSNSIGIFLNSSSFNNITSNNISNSTSVGIKVSDTSKNNTIIGNKVINGNSGMFFVYAFNTTAFNNIMENNSFNFGVGGNLLSHFEGNNIDTTNLANGRPIYYVKNGKNTIYGSSTKASTFYCILCNNVTVKDLEMSNMDRGVYFWETSNSRIQNITVKQSGWGIFLRLSHDNTIRDSKFSTNNIQDYSETGVTLYSSDNNTFENNTFILNNYGIELYSSSKNTIYNNYFNNTNNFVFKGTYLNAWNITKKPGTNIIGGSYLGGNFWANPSGNGFSQICLDSNNDGICDLKYSIDNINIDYLPLKYKTAITAGITVVSPNGGENWTRGTTQTIRWTSTGNPGAYVKIELLKAGVWKSNIIAMTPNDGTHPWPILPTQAPGTDYKVRITTGAGYTDTSDDDFTIPTPNITVITPNGGENWRRGTTQTIRWNSSGFPGTYVKIELLKGGVLNRLIVASTPNDGAHPGPILVAQAPGTDYKVKITSTTNAAYNDISEDNFTIPVPTITVLSPNGTDIWTRGTTKTIKWNSTESPGTYVKIELLRPGKPNQLIITSTLNDGSHPWLIPPALAPGDDYKVRITSTINVSNNDTSDDSFTIPTPSITVVNPDGEENWVRGATKIINWTSTENPRSYVRIELLKAGVLNRVIVAGTLNDGSHPWLIPPTLAPGNDYKVKITSTINVSNNDTSDYSFTIPMPSITVLTPNGGENWTRGTTKTINWTSTENPRSYVRIELLKGGVLNRVVVAGTLNDGSHPWPILAAQAPGTDYQVRITSTANISIKDTSDNNFTIPIPSITVATPNGGETWRRGTTQTIKWNSTESPGTYVKIELLKAGVLNRVIASSTLNDGSNPWFIPATQTLGSDFKIRINSTINPANTDSSDNNFNITG